MALENEDLFTPEVTERPAESPVVDETRKYTKEGALIIAQVGRLRVIRRPLRKKTLSTRSMTDA